MFDSFQWYDYARLATIVLALVSLYLLTRTILTGPKRNSPWPVQNYFYAVLAFLILSVVEATESLLVDRSLNNTTFISLLAVVFSFKAVRTKKIADLVVTAVVANRESKGK